MFLNVNGQTHEVHGDAERDLLGVLRYDLGLTGAKFGCGEGNCGACTVLIDGEATRSCITPVVAAAGRRITTIEGLSEDGHLHPVQAAFVEHTAFQCAYCTSGFIMSSVALLSREPNPDEAQIRSALSGHICRCGAYLRILRAVASAAQSMQAAKGAAQ
jgi:aerobic-type carbon monoxide dehydrogenase small subunit (CoxS/CutS family)